jgi:hypothetical protein
MVWYLTTDQVLIHSHTNSNTNKKDVDNNNNNNNNNNNKENPSYDLSIGKIQRIENKGNNSSKPHNQTLCPICKRSDKVVTDPDSREIIAATVAWF